MVRYRSYKGLTPLVIVVILTNKFKVRYRSYKGLTHLYWYPAISLSVQLDIVLIKD